MHVVTIVATDAKRKKKLQNIIRKIIIIILYIHRPHQGPQSPHHMCITCVFFHRLN